MITTISIQMNRSLVCGGIAIRKRGDDDQHECIFFDVLKKHPLQIIVGGRGKLITREEAEQLENELLEIFIKYRIPLQLGTVRITA